MRLLQVPTAASLLVAILPIVAGQSDRCTICSSGDPITLPDKFLNMVDAGPVYIKDCAKLDSLMVFVQNDTQQCADIRVLGGLCGCPFREGSCRLCPEGMEDPSALLTNPETALYNSAPKGLNGTCEFVDSYLQATFDRDEDLCASTRQEYLADCACVGGTAAMEDTAAADVTEVPTPAPCKGPTVAVPELVANADATALADNATNATVLAPNNATVDLDSLEEEGDLDEEILAVEKKNSEVEYDATTTVLESSYLVVEPILSSADSWLSFQRTASAAIFGGSMAAFVAVLV